MLEGRDWYKVDGASASAIDRLRAIEPAPLPESYLRLLSYSNGGEGPLPVMPFNLCLYPAEEVVQIEEAGHFKKFYPGFFVIGGNGGGEAVALDFRGDAPHPLVCFDMVNANLEESVLVIAPSFDAAIELIGLQGPDE
jgi:hypothetical protein